MGGTPVASSPWPLLSALAVAVIAVGLVVDRRLFVGGIIVLAAMVVEWMVQAWADRASGDPEHNRLVRDQLMQPLEFPVVAVAIAAVVVFAFSRMMLAIADNAGWAVFAAIAVVIMLVAIVIATRPRISTAVLGTVAGVALVVVVAVGIVFAAVGERGFETHEHSEGVKSVDNQANPRATITYDGSALSLQQLVIPKALWTTLVFENDTHDVHGLVIEVGTDSKGTVQTVSTPEREGPAEQAITFRILQPGTYRYYLAGDESVSGEILVPGVVAPSTTTTTQA
jgi:hypothetical protein